MDLCYQWAATSKAFWQREMGNFKPKKKKVNFTSNLPPWGLWVKQNSVKMNLANLSHTASGNCKGKGIEICPSAWFGEEKFGKRRHLTLFVQCENDDGCSGKCKKNKQTTCWKWVRAQIFPAVYEWKGHLSHNTHCDTKYNMLY